ncbi:hypothetical protein H5410_017121 [Solanum commersonii]|uniref:Uncharacterized protein n=1 Tax=Solanum commersonii TaxID=4109 RepID=A0A9J5ZYE3_SOLCO|nr:hypothetical protein H5410_017121 [Solanum commersonii]
MGSFSDDEGECRFFDAPDSISQGSDLGSNFTPIPDSGSGVVNGVSYDEWIKPPEVLLSGVSNSAVGWV